MKVYSPSDIADLLKIKTATLRKYCIMLENAGYEFQKNSRQQRYYNDTDVIVLRKLITLKDNGMTLEESVQGVVMWHKGEEQEETGITLSESETKNAIERNNADMAELKELVHKQNELIGNLVKRLDEQQDYLDKRLNERDQTLMQALNQSLETQKQIAATRNKSIWQKLFKKQ